ncbi:MAG: family 16 glycosylhydrolase, partial [Cyanobacteria bacterium J06649_11]
MKPITKTLLLFFFAFLPVFVFSQARLNLNYSEWDLVWEDEFDTYSTADDLFDSGRYREDDTRRNQGNIFNRSQVSFDIQNGYLILSTTKLPAPVPEQCILEFNPDTQANEWRWEYSGTLCDPNGNEIPDDYNYEYGGIVASGVPDELDMYINPASSGVKGKDGINDFSTCTNAAAYDGFYYGLYEIRLKYPNQDDIWPNFWLYNGADEFDIAEVNNTHKIGNGFIDWANGFSSVGTGFRENPDPTSNLKSDCVIFHNYESNISDEWHIIHMAWGPNKITIFFDGIETRTETRFAYFDCANNLRVNMKAHAFRKAFEESFDSADLLVDYVRVYKKASWDPRDDTTWDTDYMEEYETLGTSGYQVNSSANAIAAGEGNSLFFRDINNQMIYSYFVNGDINNIITHNLGNIANGGPNSFWDVHGDVVVGVNNQVFYPGMDGTLQNYYYKNLEGPGGGWQHGFVGLVAPADIINSPKVHLDCGSLDVASIAEGGNRIFYRGQDNLMHHYFWDPSHPSAQYNGWVHLNLHMEAGAMNFTSMVSGNVVAADGQKVFYRGADGRIQSFGFDGTSWNHDVVVESGNLVSSSCGSMDAVKLSGTQHIFYRGEADNQMHHLFYAPSNPDDLGNGWVHEYMPNDHPLEDVTGRVKVDTDGNVYYRGQVDFPNVYIYYNDDWYHQFCVGGTVQSYPPANYPRVTGGIAIGNTWENALIYYRDINNTVSFLNKIPSNGHFIDLPCSMDLVNDQTEQNFYLQTHSDGGTGSIQDSPMLSNKSISA